MYFAGRRDAVTCTLLAEWAIIKDYHDMRIACQCIHDVIARRDAGTCTLLADLALKENLGYMCVTENLGSMCVTENLGLH